MGAERVSKVELASPAWMALLAGLLQQYARQVPDLELSLCETFTGVPAHLDRGGDGTVAWHCILKGGEAHFSEGALAEADVLSQADYAFILPVARWIYTPEVMAEVEAYKARGAAEGKYRAAGRDPGKVPALFKEMHNDLARLTL